MLHLQLSTIQDPSVDVSAMLPAGWEALVVNGSRVIHLSAETGTCTVQAIEGDTYSIRYIVSSFISKLKLWIPPNDMVLQVWLAFKNDFVANVRGLGNIHLREGQFALVHAPRSAVEAAIKAKKEQQVIEVSYELSLVEEMYETYPEMKAFVAGIQKAKACFIGTPAIPMLHHGKDALIDVLRNDFPDRDKSYYVRMKIRELLYLSLGQALHKDAGQQVVSKEIAYKLQKVHDAFMSDFRRHYSLPDLAAIAGMNMRTLGDEFKKRYGMPPLAYYTYVRLQKAHELTLSTDLPFKAIAEMVGYGHTTSFISGFRTQYGYTPGSLRRKK